jgi:hypothetical protein
MRSLYWVRVEETNSGPLTNDRSSHALSGGSQDLGKAAFPLSGDRSELGKAALPPCGEPPELGK